MSVADRRFVSWMTLATCLWLAANSATDTLAQEKQWFEREAEWNGYSQFHFKVANRNAYLVAPKKAAAGNPWIWRARFPGYHAEMDVQMLAKGCHIAYVDVAGLFGGPSAMRIGDEFYRYITTERGLAKKPAMEGVSRGGLFVYNWAVRNSDKVACIYCDTPVCDIKSWPAGQGTGIGSPSTWKQCLAAYKLTEESAKQFDRNPVDTTKTIAGAKIPILHVVSETDRVVPAKENTYLLRDRLAKHGHSMQIISVPMGTKKSKGHHFTHPQPGRVVEFLTKNLGLGSSDHMSLLKKSRRVLFLGDSITYAGKYVVSFDAWVAATKLDHPPVVINAGLPSETVSGLSEKGHAGGRFPRPDLAERLDRVLAITKPDLVFACYGINCGIYQPFDQGRFVKYQRGIQRLKHRVENAGAILVVITPPTYDDQVRKGTFSYNAVLDRYANWLIEQRNQGWHVVDLHEPMARELAQRREANPKFTFQPDAVHPNGAGHWFMATQLIRWFGDAQAASAESPQEMLKQFDQTDEFLKIVQQRIDVRRNAYLSASGHKRPGIKAGLPIATAEKQAETLTKKLLSGRDGME